MIDLVIPARRTDLGGGLQVGRVLPFFQRRMVGPFIFLDHMGPAQFQAGQGIDVRPHPHIGLATVTYLFDGEILHRDNLGVTQLIRPGEVNWMTAGRGIVHSERSGAGVRAHGGTAHGIQTWVALPNDREEAEPAFAHYDRDALAPFDGDGTKGTVVAGTAYGLVSGVVTASPMFLVDVDLKPGARLAMPDDHEERAAYVVRGSVRSEGQSQDAGRMLVFASGAASVAAEDQGAHLVLIGGAPVGPRLIWWNFVASRQERIEEAKARWREGRMKLPQDDNREFIPLPEEPPKPKG